jgi:DNA-binding GntR family transcriptional regulator
MNKLGVRDEKRPTAISSVPEHLVGSVGRTAVLPEKLAELFRELILHGEWKPGSPLVETAVARQFGVAQPTVREALKQLEAEGLILRRPYRSCEITSLTREEVDQIFRLRIEWEALAAELAVENRGIWNPDQLAAAVQKLKEAAAARDVNAFYKYDLEFHKTLWSYTGNPFLIKALSQITIPLFAFWTLRVLRDTVVDLEQQAIAHDKIAQVIFHGDKQQAREASYQSMQEFWQEGARVAAGEP